MIASTSRIVPRPRVLSGMRPTGRLHLGNYMGALHNWVQLQQDYDCFFFIADLHALTTDYADPSRLKQSVFDVTLDFLAAGLDPEVCTLFIQSHVPQHAELHLIFSMFTPLGWLERVPTYKDQQAQLAEKDLNTYGFLGYPLLQSADILLYRPHYVPVGADQIAHVELTREVARKFNALYSPKRVSSGSLGLDASRVEIELDPDRLLLREPDVLLTETPKLPGLDGRKMSKSYGNAIYLSDPMPVVMQKAESMTNGGQRPTQKDPGDPEICPVGDLHRVFSKPEIDQQIREGCRTATLRCDRCKMVMGASVFAHLQPIQTRRAELQEKPGFVWEVLEKGARRAEQAALDTMTAIRNATGLSRGLEGVRIHTPQWHTENARNSRDLSNMQDWRGLAPAILQRNVRELWRKEVLPTEAALTPESEGVWLTQNKRRVLVVAATQNGLDEAWIFSTKPKTYEIIVLLCWDDRDMLHDFVVPQKIFLGHWVLAKRAAGKGNITFSIERENDRYYLNIGGYTPSFDITETEQAYGIL
ncbi:tryptophan--tRNA ligase [Bryocella elongata]|nr:tryptophan--tRNA ligase [Bryocella elongata]